MQILTVNLRVKMVKKESNFCYASSLAGICGVVIKNLCIAFGVRKGREG